MDKKEERLTALQNVATVLFVIGIILGMGSMNGFTFILAAICVIAGGTTVMICEYLLDQIKRRRKKRDEAA